MMVSSTTDVFRSALREDPTNDLPFQQPNLSTLFHQSNSQLVSTQPIKTFQKYVARSSKTWYKIYNARHVEIYYTFCCNITMEMECTYKYQFIDFINTGSRWLKVLITIMQNSIFFSPKIVIFKSLSTLMKQSIINEGINQAQLRVLSRFTIIILEMLPLALRRLQWKIKTINLCVGQAETIKYFSNTIHISIWTGKRRQQWRRSRYIVIML